MMIYDDIHHMRMGKYLLGHCDSIFGIFSVADYEKLHLEN
mgnify:CR=1 FL=1